MSDTPTIPPDAADFFKGLDQQLGGNILKAMPDDVKSDDVKSDDVKSDDVKSDDVKSDDVKSDDLVFEPKTRQAKPTKDESVAVLRKQRDEAVQAAKTFNELFKDNKPESIKPIFDFLVESIEGPVTQEAVIAKIEEFKLAKEEKERLAKELEDNERKVMDLDIRHSKDFEANFNAPYKEAANLLMLEFAQVDGSKILGPKSTKEFNDFLLDNADKDATAIKSALNLFAKQYKAETGEDPTLPGITDLMKSLRSFGNKRKDLHDAYNNWSVKKKEKEQERLIREQEDSEKTNKMMTAKRRELTTKAYNNFNLDELPFIEESEIQSLFKEEFNLGEDIRKGKVPEYDEFVTRGVNARLWDKHKKEFAELKKFKEDYDAGERNDLPGNDAPGKSKQVAGADWLTARI